MRRVIVHPAGVIESERPEVNVEFFGPVKIGVLHHGASTFGDRSNGAFGDPVLMVSADTG